MSRIFLSAPHMGGKEFELLRDAYESNWIAPVGPHLDRFEQEIARHTGCHAVGVASGTAAIHTALQLLGVHPGDEVFCSTLTFIASANPILYQGAQPVFIDSSPDTWNMDPGLLREELETCARSGKLPRAVIVVDLYGQSADYDPILSVCEQFGVPVLEDSAEALGSTYKGRPCGSFGAMGVFSFNGNKIITTSGGGMLISSDRELAQRARFLTTQARDSAPHYEHSVMGYNYRLSNLLAAVGIGQLQCLQDRIAARTEINRFYQEHLQDLPGLRFMPIAEYGVTNHWLTCITIDPDEFGASREDVRIALEADDIEARPVWKPMHLQPVFEGCRVRGGWVSSRIFDTGLCLPSGSALTVDELYRVVTVIRSVHANGGRYSLRCGGTVLNAG